MVVSLAFVFFGNGNGDTLPVASAAPVRDLLLAGCKVYFSLIEGVQMMGLFINECVVEVCKVVDG